MTLRRSTIQDVADAARVSRSVVSRVLNNAPIRISEEKRKTIQAAARRLNYTPHAGARRLALQKSETLRLILPEQTSAVSEVFVMELMRCITQAARAAGYDIVLDLYQPCDLERLVSRPGQADGTMLILDRNAPPEMVTLLEGRIQPLVTIGGSFAKTQPANFVDADIREGLATGTSHLLALGHRRIAFLSDVPSKAKYEGYLQALRRFGKNAHPLPELVCGESAETSAKAIRKIMNDSTRPTAVVCTTDTLALRVIQHISALDMHVPNDLSVVGFYDNIIASLTNPALTTVRVPTRAIAEATIDYLVKRIRGTNTPALREVLPCELIVRQSSAAAGTAA